PPVAPLRAVAAPITVLRAADDEERTRSRALDTSLAAIRNASRPEPSGDRFGDVGGTMRRYLPDEVVAAIRAGARCPIRHHREGPMRVVYSPTHLGHDIDTETYMGVGVPANEVAERAERIRSALLADGGFPFAEPTEHGEGPITAVHDEGLIRFL